MAKLHLIPELEEKLEVLILSILDQGIPPEECQRVAAQLIGGALKKSLDVPAQALEETGFFTDTDTLPEQPKSKVLMPALQEAIEDLIQTIYGYEGSDATAPKTVTEAQAIASVAIRKLLESGIIAEAINFWH